MAEAGRHWPLRLLCGPNEHPGADSVPALCDQPVAAHARATQPEASARVGAYREAQRRLAPHTSHPSSVAGPALRRQPPEVGATCGKAARVDLSGGRPVTGVPTAKSRPSTRTIRLPAGPERPAGGGRGGRTAVPRTPRSGRYRPRGFLWEHSSHRTNEIGGAPGRRPAGAASAQDVARVLRRGNRRPRTEATLDRGPRQRPWHSARVTNLTTAGKSLHAAVRAGMGEARAAATPGQSDRDLRRRSRGPVQTGQG